MSYALRLFCLFLVTGVLSCNDPIVKSKDFTEEGSFTPGIEGPAFYQGHLYAVNFEKEGTIGKVDKDGKGEVFTELPNGSIGNGIRFSKSGDMYIADYVNHNVLIIKKGTTQAAVYAHHQDLNQPNDLAMAPNGTLYASDPNWADSTGKLWKVDDKGFHLLEDQMGTTNGIEVSPDGKWLYVNESIQRNIWRYVIDDSGNVSGKELFYSFEDHGMDGMRCDNQGNLYICRYDAGKVVVLSPSGQLLQEIQLTGKKPSNIAFGGVDGRTCYVTLADRGCIEVFQAEHPGRDY